MAIRFFVLQNRAGKTRLAKYYTPLSDSEKHKLEYDVHRLIVGRDPKHTNFTEVGRAAGPPDRAGCGGAAGGMAPDAGGGGVETPLAAGPTPRCPSAPPLPPHRSTRPSRSCTDDTRACSSPWA